MRGYNRVILAGNVTRTPEIKTLPSGTDVAEFGMAMNRKWKSQNGEDRDEVCFVDCALFGKGCEALMQYVDKGDPLLIEGRLKFDQWDDRQSGAKRSKLSIIVDTFTLIGGNQSGDDGGQSSTGNSAPRGVARGLREKVAERGPAERPFGDEQQFKEDDIPF